MTTCNELNYLLSIRSSTPRSSTKVIETHGKNSPKNKCQRSTMLPFESKCTNIFDTPINQITTVLNAAYSIYSNVSFPI